MNDIELSALKTAIARVGKTFATKDVSEQVDLKKAHGDERSSRRNWHADVGKAISANRGELGVSSIGRAARGELWKRWQAATSATASAPVPMDLGPQSRGDAPFVARMRLHQSWWRAEVLKVPFGHGPLSASKGQYGNMLVAVEAASGKNFLTDEIHAVAKRRLADRRGMIEPFRLLHNLLSSQPI